MSSSRRDTLVAHLKLREGVVDRVYLDSLGKLTGGVGHLLSHDEYSCGLYQEGDSLAIDTINRWLEEDLQEAIESAREQSYQIPYCTVAFEDALVSVNFQLGSNWYKKFPTAWDCLKRGDFNRARDEIQYTKQGSGIPSLWMKQTPLRVRDFLLAIDDLICRLPTKLVTKDYSNCKTIT